MSQLRRLIPKPARQAVRNLAGRSQPVGSRSIPVAAEPVRWSACYAPHASMYFDQFGKVRACCQNTGVYLGDVTTQTLREIWESAEAEQMRTALEHDDYSAGCEFCEWQVREGNEDILFARQYDYLQPEDRRPTWPRMMEFSVTNACNLQCAMCDGTFSSSIRSQREGLPPLPKMYGDAFFEQLEEFLPHLRYAKFAGGEPFLGAEPLRILEMLGQQDPVPEVTIITNGTILTPRVKRIVEALRPIIIMSIDGATPSTYDAIRVGAHLPDVLAHLDHFQSVLPPQNVSITTCLMIDNWHEFAAVLRLGEERNIDVGVNVVRFPEHQSLYQLEADALGPIVEAMESTDVSLTGTRLAAWNGHVAALRHRLEVVRQPHPDMGPAHGLPGAPMGSPGAETTTVAGSEPDEATELWDRLPFPRAGGGPRAGSIQLDAPDRAPLVAFTVDLEGTISVDLATPDDRVALDLDRLDGAPADQLARLVEEALGPEVGWQWPDVGGGMPDEVRLLAKGAAPGLALVVHASALRSEQGMLLGARFAVEVIADC